MKIAKRSLFRPKPKTTTTTTVRKKPSNTTNNATKLRQSRQASEGLKNRLKENAEKQNLPTFRNSSGTHLRGKLFAQLEKRTAQTDDIRQSLKKDDPPVTREVLRDPSHATRRNARDNSSTDTIADDIGDINGDGRINNSDVTAKIEQNKEAEEAAMGELSTQERTMYEGLQETTEGDVRAELALQDMLLDGRLPGESDSLNGTNLLQELDRMNNIEDLPSSVDKKELVSDIIQEIEDPSSIAQRNTPTCAPTTTAIYLAENKPSEYARIVADLADTGKSKVANGATIIRQASAEGEERTSSLSLFAGAAMEYANGTDTNYNGADYTHIDRETGEVRDGRGLFSGEFDRIFDAVTGIDSEVVRVNDDNRSENMDRIAETTNSGEMVPVGIKWGEGGHKILVTKVEGDFVYYTNPWGTEERMSTDEFEARLRNAHFMP